MEIKRQIVAGAPNTYDGTNPCTHITVHMTGNTNAGADAQAHANLQTRGNSRNASWHWTVDDREAIQSYEDTARCWHAGDGRGNGNMASIAIEVCVNSDGDYVQAVKNAAELVRRLMDTHGIPITHVVQHNHWSGKNCPTQIRAGKDGISWADFLALVLDGAVEVSRPVAPPTSSGLAVDGWWGKATTSRLQEVLGTPVDGEVWSQSNRWERANPGLTSGWKWVASSAVGNGSRVIRAMQERLGVTADGLIGPNTINALSAHYGIKGDGVLDGPSKTVRAMQAALNTGKF